MKNENILFFTRTMRLGGTENVILQLIETLIPFVNKIVVCSCGGVNEEKLQKMGVKHYTIPDIEKKSIPIICKVTHVLNRIIDEEKISIIHTHHRMAAFYCQLLLRKKNLIFISTAHTVFFDKKILTKIAYRGFGIVACGENVRKSLIQDHKISSEQVTVISNGIEITDRYESEIPELKKLQEKQKCLVGYIGRLSAEKGVKYLVEAAKDLSGTDTAIVIVGTGPEEEDLKKMVREFDLSESVIFLGYRQDIFNVINQMDFIVQPSLVEGLPLVPIEAFSIGKTVVGTRIPGNEEVIQDGKNGLLVEAANAKELARAIEYMRVNDRTSFEHEAFQTYKKKYSLEEFSKRYLEYYRSRISRRDD